MTEDLLKSVLLVVFSSLADENVCRATPANGSCVEENA